MMRGTMFSCRSHRSGFWRGSFPDRHLNPKERSQPDRPKATGTSGRTATIRRYPLAVAAEIPWVLAFLGAPLDVVSAAG